MGIRVAGAMLCGLTLFSALSVQAAPVPVPGLWENRSTLVLNGKDVTREINEIAQASARGLPAELRAQEGLQPDGAQRHCLTPEAAARQADPKAVIAWLERNQPGCRFQPVGATTGATLKVSGQCQSGVQGGFAGNMQGEFTRVSARETRAVFTGKGRFGIRLKGMPSTNEAYEARSTYHSRWLGRDCGVVLPSDDDEEN